MDDFFRELPKVELHAHLNGSLSLATILELQRYHADAGIPDNTNTFFDEFQIGSGDSRSLSRCLQLFSIAHNLTNTPEALRKAVSLTLQEFQEDGCCYIELRSTPRETPHMNKKQYIEAIVGAMLHSSSCLTIVSRLIVSIDRRSSALVANEIADLTIEFHKLHPDVVVGIELSGDPNRGEFKEIVPALEKARTSGLKVSLHCGEVCNPDEVLEMLQFKPDRIGHGICIHPRYGGTQDTWSELCKAKIPVEVCLTSNVKTKSVPLYEDHHLKELCDANIPVIICTDDKGVFLTSLSQEYRLCFEVFNMNKSQLARLSLSSCQYVFAEDVRANLSEKLNNFIERNNL